MQIIIATNKGVAEKFKGDLLEQVAGEFLRLQNYHVEEKIRQTGTELDLLCKDQANNSKTIYVECKAYKTNKIDSNIIKNLVGTREIKKHSEAWLISTTELNSDAKGLVRDIDEGSDARLYTFYTPTKIIEAFTNAKLIISEQEARNNICDYLNEQQELGEATLLITKYGKHWLIERSRNQKGIIVVNASMQDRKVIHDQNLLTDLSSTDHKLSYDFLCIFSAPNVDEDGHKNLSIKDINLSQSYLNELNDMGLKFNSLKTEEMLLEDIFVYPDIEDIEEENKDYAIINSVELLGESKESTQSIIFGEEVAGKTSLSHALQKDLDQKGYIALYLNAREIKTPSTARFDKLLKRAFKQQYNNGEAFVQAFDRLLAEDKLKLFLIIDDFHLLGMRRPAARNILFKKLNNEFKNVFILANDSFEIELIADSEARNALQDFRLFRIKQLGHVLRDQLIEKWLIAENKDFVSDGEIHNRKPEICKKIEIAIGRNFMPTHPLYLLTMLQIFEDGENSAGGVQGNSYAELYSYLINHALRSVKAKPDKLDFYHTYLSYLAHYLFENGKKELLLEEIVEIYGEYSEKMDIDIDFDIVHRLLIDAKLLKHNEQSYSFGYIYVYYYFVAKYISDNIESQQAQKNIDEAVEKLHQEENSNIIIFLIHHSKRKEIVDRVVEQAAKIFTTIEPFDLAGKDVDTINALAQEKLNIVTEEPNPYQHRRKELERADRIESTEKEPSDESINAKGLDELTLYEKINLSFKMMQVLGQITNNYYGSLDGERKAKVLNEIYLLGFKALKAVLDDLENYLPGIKNDIQETLDKKNVISDAEKIKIADKIIFQFIGMVVYVFTKKCRDNIASRNLFKTLERLSRENEIAAIDFIKVAVRLNFPGALERDKEHIINIDRKYNKNHLMHVLLRWFVLEHMYKFDIDRALKSSICDKLGIKLLPGRRP